MTTKTKTARKPKTKITESALEKRKRLAQERVAKGEERIATVQMQLSKMRDNGILVDPEARGESIFTTPVTWAELGIADESVRRKKFGRGRKDIAPKDIAGKIRSIVNRFRALFNKELGYDIEGFKPYVYITWEDWAKIAERKIAELQAERDEVVASFRENRDAVLDWIGAEWKPIAEEAWDQLTLKRKKVIGIDGHEFSKEQFIDAVISAVQEKLPTADDLDKRFTLKYRTAVLAMESDVQAERLKREKLYAEEQATRLAAEKARRELEAALVKAESEARSAKQKADHEARLQALREESDRREAEARTAAARQAEYDARRQMLLDAAEPFNELLGQFAARALEGVKAIEKSFKKNGKLQGRTAAFAANLIEAYRRAASVQNDEQLEALLAEMRKLAKSDDKKRDPKVTKAALEKNLKALTERLSSMAADRLAAEDDRYSNLEID